MNSSREPLPEKGGKAKDPKHVSQHPDDHLGRSYAPATEGIVGERPDHTPPMFGPAYQAWVRTRIERHMEEAEKFASVQDFTSALHMITLGYIMSPVDESLRMCERRILDLQQRVKASGQLSPPLATGNEMTTGAPGEEDGSLMMRVSEHIDEADRLCAGHRFDEALDEIAKALTLDPLNESIRRYEKTIHEAYIRAQEEAQQRVRRVKELRVNRCYEEALEEIALGLVGEPDSPLLLELEQEILREHPGLVAESPENRAEGTEDRVQIHLEAAEEFRKVRKYPEALDEISKAYAIDPANEEISKTEQRIRESEARPNQPRSLFISNPFRNRRILGGRS